METAALTLASLSAETATPARLEAQPPGEFAKILKDDPVQAETPSGKRPKGREGDPLPAAETDIPVLLPASLPAFLPAGVSLSGETGLPASLAGSQKSGNHGAAQNTDFFLPDSGMKNGPPVVIPKERFGWNSATLLENPFHFGPPPEGSPLPSGSPAENPNPGKGAELSSAAQNSRMSSPDPRFWNNQEGGQESWGDLKNAGKSALSNIDADRLLKGNDLFPNDLTSAEISTPGNSKAEGLFANPAAPGGRSEAARPAGEIRFEGTPASSQHQKAEVYDQISQKMIWSLGRNEERFRLTLDPPHLGGIYLEIQRDKEQVRATLWAENPHTKQTLESNQLSIQKIIESEGFSLESFNVFVERDLGAFQESRERMGNPEPAASAGTGEAKDGPGPGPALSPLFARGSGGLRSIDLII